jgi:hypothetical protein
MQTGTTLKQRLAEFLADLGIGQKKFAEIVGLSKGFANNVGDSIRTENLKKIEDAYPDLNLVWLLTGHGNMRKNDPPTIDTHTERITGQHNTRIGNVGGNAYAGSEDIDRLIAENKRLAERVEKLTDDNMRLIERINYLTDRLIEKSANQ